MQRCRRLVRLRCHRGGGDGRGSTGCNDGFAVLPVSLRSVTQAYVNTVTYGDALCLTVTSSVSVGYISVSG